MILVTFLNVVVGSGRVLRRTFASETEYLQWLATVRPIVEILDVRPLAPAQP